MIYGIHALNAMIDRSPERLIQIYIHQERDNKRFMSVMKEIELLGIPTMQVDKKKLDQMSHDAVHQGIIALITPAKQYSEQDVDHLIEYSRSQKKEPFILILDNITDPHNLGACIRTADASGIDFIIVPKDRSATVNATAKKVASGAAETIPVVRVTNLVRTMRHLKDQHQIWIVGTDGDADKTLFDSNLTGALAIVMGAEGDGMRRLTKEHCDQLINIPMAGLVSSLNVSVATGVCLFEVVRQRSKNTAQ